MAIQNRDLGLSEQRKVVDFRMQNVGVAGQTLALCHVPAKSTLDAIQVASAGLANSPQLAIEINRFIPSVGLTTIAVGVSNMVLQEFGASGPLGFSGIAASGSTLLNLEIGDVVCARVVGASAAIQSLVGNVVLKRVEDIVKILSLTS